MKVALLHGYSASNAGDGLLVEESLGIVREALGDDVEFILAASHPETFEYLGITTVNSAPGKRGYDRAYLDLLRGLDDLDLVVGVGGGYLRAGYLEEAAKMALVHGPQLLAAGRTSTPTIYLPQSVGPAKSFTYKMIGQGVGKVRRFYVRDDRSLAEYGPYGAVRASDLAILGADAELGDAPPAPVPVVSARPVRGVVPPLVLDLCRQIGTFEGYVQSATSGNDDRSVMNSIGATRILTRSELMTPGSETRVVVAVRLHAALMALRAGHFVIHLAYERKGFGAFEDLGIADYVHNVNMFEPERILRQIDELISDPEVRDDYRSRQRRALDTASVGREALVNDIRALAMSGSRPDEFEKTALG
ncbi:polysaccharide pyruvyl transferase family protein [Prescottella agglutinans]|uniref:Polysaccharide pyruvyl transferase family protein n=1 Tax=Prescottella agglutinans TaxID=1644129 RepID=A0A438BF84_9NOCA|nr:polysaccharide pyruvyl transferase family protein [Prescottella agglutinans]RVW09325.1 polysaccharide pyruvyl transferase family protein [Prescottella agglutinans]